MVSHNRHLGHDCSSSYHTGSTHSCETRCCLISRICFLYSINAVDFNTTALDIFSLGYIFLILVTDPGLPGDS